MIYYLSKSIAIAELKYDHNEKWALAAIHVVERL
jgi:hypothetical protein